MTKLRRTSSSRKRRDDLYEVREEPEGFYVSHRSFDHSDLGPLETRAQATALIRGLRRLARDVPRPLTSDELRQRDALLTELQYDAKCGDFVRAYRAAALRRRVRQRAELERREGRERSLTISVGGALAPARRRELNRELHRRSTDKDHRANVLAEFERLVPDIMRRPDDAPQPRNRGEFDRAFLLLPLSLLEWLRRGSGGELVAGGRLWQDQLERARRDREHYVAIARTRTRRRAEPARAQAAAAERLYRQLVTDRLCAIRLAAAQALSTEGNFLDASAAPVGKRKGVKGKNIVKMLASPEAVPAPGDDPLDALIAFDSAVERARFLSALIAALPWQLVRLLDFYTAQPDATDDDVAAELKVNKARVPHLRDEMYRELKAAGSG